MRPSAILFLASTLFGTQVVAQDFIGFANNVFANGTSRGFLSYTIGGEVMTRISGQDYAGYGTGTPNKRTITGLFFTVQDQDAATTELFDIKLYPESLANPGFPDLAAGVIFAAGLLGPLGGSGASATTRIVTPVVPASVPIVGNGDVFVSWVLPASPNGRPTDGLSIQVLDGTLFDVPGPSMFPQTPAGPSNSRAITLTPPSTLAYSVARQWVFDAAHSGAGGVALTMVNPGPLPSGLGTASFLSGTHPDVNGFHAGRADDIAFLFFLSGLGTGQTVLFLLDGNFGPTFGPEIPVSTVFPGSSGSTCLVNYTTFSPFFGQAQSNAGEASATIAIPATLRPLLSGLTIRQQAAAIVGTNFVASPCAAQHF